MLYSVVATKLMRGDHCSTKGDMIKRLTSDELRNLADQLDSIRNITKKSGIYFDSNTVLTINGIPKSHLFWWEDGCQYMAEFLDFVPGDGPFKSIAGIEIKVSE